MHSAFQIVWADYVDLIPSILSFKKNNFGSAKQGVKSQEHIQGLPRFRIILAFPELL
jgi:hypothetical protein